MNIGALTPSTSSSNPVPSTSSKSSSTKNTKNIWDTDEVLPSSSTKIVVDDSVSDGRKRPEYDISYKQKVGAEDVFLGMSGTTPSSIHCDTIVVKVKLPGANLNDIDVDVHEDGEFLLLSSEYRLRTYMPVKVKHKEGQAQWDKQKQTLTVSLPIIPGDIW